MASSIRQLRRKLAREWKQSKIEPPPPSRLAILRHRRGQRGHETEKFVK